MEKTQDLREDPLRLSGQFSLAGAGQGMGDEGKRILGGAVRLCDGPAIGYEGIGADNRGRDATPLQQDAVEHTAR